MTTSSGGITSEHLYKERLPAMTLVNNQKDQLDYLVEKFKEDSYEYKDLAVPEDTEGKRRIQIGRAHV